MEELAPPTWRVRDERWRRNAGIRRQRAGADRAHRRSDARNRSLDHMLGYLRLEAGREDIDGLQPGMAEAHAVTDLQQEMLAVDQAARDEGHPAGQP